jgi:hypothetical protein
MGLVHGGSTEDYVAEGDARGIIRPMPNRECYRCTYAGDVLQV